MNGDTCLHDLGGGAINYLSYIPFEQIYCGHTTECIIGMRFFIWCIIKLDFYVTFCGAFHTLTVANNISHLGIKFFSWRWGVSGVTKKLDFYDHI